MNNQLKLDALNPKLWWNRNLDINSFEWKEIRQKVLERDNYSCNFCKIRLSKYMVVDHVEGGAIDNSLSNLRLNCPACDRIRHCGLAGIHQVLVAGKSKLNQVEIVQKTVKYYLKNKSVPKPREIDKKVIIAGFPPVLFVDDLNYKGFFTEEMDFSYLKWIIKH